MKLYALLFQSDEDNNKYIGLVAGFKEMIEDVKNTIYEDNATQTEAEAIQKKVEKELIDNELDLDEGYTVYTNEVNKVWIQELSGYSCEQAKKYANTQTGKQDGIVETVMMNIGGIEVYVEKGQETNFAYRISKSEAERLFNTYRKLPFDVMCKEYGDDDDWVGMSIEDINEDNEFDDDYKTFEIY